MCYQKMYVKGKGGSSSPHGLKLIHSDMIDKTQALTCLILCHANSPFAPMQAKKRVFFRVIFAPSQPIFRAAYGYH